MLYAIFVATSWLFAALGCAIVIIGMIGYMRYNDFYVRNHCMLMVNLYGINIILLALGINSYSTSIFFKTIFIIILNTLSNLAFVHCLIRRHFNEGFKINAKNRKEVEKEKEEKREQAILAEREEIIKKHEEENKKIQAEQDKEKAELEAKIKEQKKKLKEKIDKARFKAKMSKDQDYIDDTEKMIADILAKYNLTEESLNDV